MLKQNKCWRSLKEFIIFKKILQTILNGILGTTDKTDSCNCGVSCTEFTLKVLHSYPDTPEDLFVGSELEYFRQYCAALLLGLSRKTNTPKPPKNNTVCETPARVLEKVEAEKMF